jgi:hypothetical protein
MCVYTLVRPTEFELEFFCVCDIIGAGNEN